jgi:wyosine [tRNA(Phe)-imidazoG37] synthetase (radical SAM superfamily)
MKYDFFTVDSYTFFNKESILKDGTDYPKMLNIEPTNDCNYDCVMCSRKNSNRPIGNMSMSLFCSIIDDVVKNGKEILWLTLHNDGESLMHPQLPEMIQYAKSSGAIRYVHFNTNAQLLTKELAIKLIESGLDDLTISIDAISQKTFHKVKRAGDLETVTKNTIQLMDLKKQMGKQNPWVRAKIIDMPTTKHEIDAFKDFWTPLVDEVQVQAIHNAAGSLRIKPKDQITRHPCSLLWYSVSIKWDGLVSPCCVDLTGDNPLGDLKIESLKDVFKDGKIKQYREKMLNGQESELSPCNNCDVWKNGINLFEEES